MLVMNTNKGDGFLPILAEIYDFEETKSALIAFQDEFSKWDKNVHKQNNCRELKEKIADKINDSINYLGHKPDKCRCIENNYRDRSINDSMTRYFGFTDTMEIMTQQKMDSIHCGLCHNYDQGESDITIETQITDSDEDNKDESKTIEDNETSNFKNILKRYRTYKKYDPGYRFFYWPFYQYKEDKYLNTINVISEPGNQSFCI